MVACLKDILKGIGNGCRSRSYRQSGYTTFQYGHPFLKNTLCGVGQSSVDISGITKPEAVGRMLGITEYIRSGLIDRYCAGIGCRIRLFLTYVELQCLKVKFCSFHNSIVLSLYDVLFFDAKLGYAVFSYKI